MISWIINSITILLLIIVIYLYLSKTQKAKKEENIDCSHNNFVYNLLTESIDNTVLNKLLISDKYKNIKINYKNMLKYVIKIQLVNGIFTDLELFQKLLKLYDFVEYQYWNLDEYLNSQAQDAEILLQHNQENKIGIVILSYSDWNNLDKNTFTLNLEINKPNSPNQITYVLLLDTSMPDY